MSEGRRGNLNRLELVVSQGVGLSVGRSNHFQFRFISNESENHSGISSTSWSAFIRRKWIGCAFICGVSDGHHVRDIHLFLILV